LGHRLAGSLDVQDLLAPARARAMDLDPPLDDDVEPVARLAAAEQRRVLRQPPRDRARGDGAYRIAAQAGEQRQAAQALAHGASGPIIRLHAGPPVVTGFYDSPRLVIRTRHTSGPCSRYSQP